MKRVVAKALLWLGLLLAFGPGWAGAKDTVGAESEEEADRRLCALVAESPVALEAAVREVAALGRRVLGARFLAGAAGLELEVLAFDPEGPGAFERLRGPVEATGWRREVQAPPPPADLVRAARFEALLGLSAIAVDEALRRALAARDPEGRRAVRLVAFEPRREGESVRMACTVVVEGLPWTTWHGADGGLQELRPPPYVAARAEAARRWKGKELPEVDFAQGEWINVDEPVRLARWRGSHVLVALTDPG